MTTHEILVAAKGYLLNHGWLQGALGNHGGPRCAVGSIREGCGLGERHGWSEEGLRALGILRVALGTPEVAYWNDRAERTFDDVIAALDAAILQTAPKDTPAPQPETPSPSVTRVFA